MGVDKYSEFDRHVPAIFDSLDSSRAAVNDFFNSKLLRCLSTGYQIYFANFLIICLVYINYVFLPTAREGNVFRGMCHSIHNQPHNYFGHCSSFLWRRRYASYWNAFLC